MKTIHSAASRRAFLRHAGSLGVLGAAAPWALNLAASASAAAATAGDDYKALVCLFMLGGNDHFNTVIPFDTATYNTYADIRGGIAVPYGSLAGMEISPANPWGNGRQMALHPSLLPMKNLFDEGHLAMAMNLGPLTQEGVNLNQYKAGIGIPPKLFSHNDQQSVWQSSLAEGASSGWGGRMADLMLANNEASSALFTGISASGNAVFLSGKDAVQYQVSSAGSIAIKAGFGATTDASAAVKNMIQTAGKNLFEREHAVVAQRSIAADIRVRDALATVGEPAFPATSLGAQLKIVARLIAARQQLGVKRQVFFVALGGFDQHDALMTTHPVLLATVADAMRAFYAATQAMGVANQVTTFTGSDFGRTLASNGDGSDHGWGSHHMVMGGAVAPKTWVGALPKISLAQSNDNVGGGRLLPAIGVDQYGATLASWMGVPDDKMRTVFPNIGNYTRKNLGFMQPT